MAYLQTKNPLDYTEETTGSTSGNIANPKLTSSMSVGGFSQNVAEPAAVKPLTASWGGTTTSSTPNANIIPGAALTKPQSLREPTTGGLEPQPHPRTGGLEAQSQAMAQPITGGLERQQQPKPQTGGLERQPGVWNDAPTAEKTQASAAPQSSGMFTNLQNYLGGNQAAANTMGTQLASSINQQNTQANTVLSAARNDFLTRVKAGTTAYNPQLLEAYLNNPTAYANNPQVKAMLSGAYSGPTTFDDAATTAAMQKAIETGTLSQDVAGREQLMRNLAPGNVGGAGGALNQFLVQNTAPAFNQVAGATTNIAGLGDIYSKAMGEMGTAAGTAIKGNQTVQQQALARVNQFQAEQQAAAARAAEEAAAKRQAEQEAANKKIMDDFLAKAKAAQQVAPAPAPTTVQGNGYSSENPYETPEQKAKWEAWRARQEEERAIFLAGQNSLNKANQAVQQQERAAAQAVAPMAPKVAAAPVAAPVAAPAPAKSAVNYTEPINREWFQANMGRAGTAEELAYWNNRLNANPAAGGQIYEEFLKGARSGQGTPGAAATTATPVATPAPTPVAKAATPAANSMTANLEPNIFEYAKKNPGGIKDAQGRGTIYMPGGQTRNYEGDPIGEPIPGWFYRNNEDGKTGNIYDDNGNFIKTVPQGQDLTIGQMAQIAIPIVLAASGLPVSLATGISGATGLGMGASQILAGAAIGGGTAALTGGNVGKGIVTGGIAAGVPLLVDASGALEALPSTAQNAFKGVATSVALGKDPTQALVSGGLSAITSQIPGYSSISPEAQKIVNTAITQGIMNRGNISPQALLNTAVNIGAGAIKNLTTTVDNSASRY